MNTLCLEEASSDIILFTYLFWVFVLFPKELSIEHWWILMALADSIFLVDSVMDFTRCNMQTTSFITASLQDQIMLDLIGLQKLSLVTRMRSSAVLYLAKCC